MAKEGTFWRIWACFIINKGDNLGIDDFTGINSGQKMNCQEAQPLIDDYLDGLLDSSQREQLTAHLNQCVDCAEALAQERQFRQMLKSAPLPPPSTGFVDRALRQAVQQAGRQGSKPGNRD